MAEPARIQDIQQRVREFTGALRQAGANDLAKQMEQYARGFADHGQVRRSVAAIQQQLQHFRSYPEQLPDMPIVQVAANRLEDVCRAALAAPRIEAARPSLRTAGKRKLVLIFTTVLGAGLCFAIPLALTRYGVDWSDLPAERAMRPLRLEQGQNADISLTALMAAEMPDAVSGVEFYPAGRCPTEMGRGLRCRSAGPQDWPNRPEPDFEIILQHEAYGVLLGFGDAELIGGVAHGHALVAATWDTPEGRYEVPLQAAFAGYSPERCDLLQRIQGRCESKRIGPDAKHEGVPVATLVLDVVRGDPSAVTRVVKAEREVDKQAEDQAARARAAELAEHVAQIETVLDETQGMLRKQAWEQARAQLEKLAELFSPLDALVVGGDDVLPAGLAMLRARFEAQRKRLGDFEDGAFEKLYESSHAGSKHDPPAKQRRAKRERASAPGSGEGEGEPSRPEDQQLSAVARKLRISEAYLEAIYAAHADQLEQRLAAGESERRNAATAAQGALVRKCGELPKGAFSEVKAYLGALAREQRVRTALRECMTPRLAGDTCWSIVCNFDEIVPGDLTDTSHPRTWTFLFKHGHVVEHAARALD